MLHFPEKIRGWKATGNGDQLLLTEKKAAFIANKINLQKTTSGQIGARGRGYEQK